ncbi:S-adenosyl-L-methionine-dependent methyltransferase [Artemisia annua]|uniref:Methyltransferase n=1 Tax=Artemisia annua TaxID=35608 RepID=A0A2U1NGR3_ARTAN|nr:S-adenosyl-L-methionine-dependent methyltransferase [Artemisia annua]
MPRFFVEFIQRRMSRPLHRGFSGGGRLSGNIQDFLEDSQMKVKPEKDDFDKNRLSPDKLSSWNPFQSRVSTSPPSKQTENGNGFHDPYSPVSSRNRYNLTLSLLKFSLFVIVILALTGSFWWTLSLTTSARGHHTFRGYRRLQEQLVSDLWDIGELSVGGAKIKESDFCSRESENYVPCFNVTESLELGLTEGQEQDRYCGLTSKQNCLVPAPSAYKIPHRWPTGRDVIWIDNVKINAQQVLSSGSLTKRMMLLDEDQISFSFASSMVDDNIEDYSHQIAEMIGLRNVSYLVQAGVRTVLDIGCGFGSLGAHLFPKQLLTMCVANYESSGSQVEITLERGLPAMVASFTSKKLPFPSLSYDMVHSAWDGIDWNHKGTILVNFLTSFNFVRTVLDIGCGFGSLGAHLFPKQLLTMCVANYESSGSQVEITLERGLPAMVASFTSKKLPFPSLSYDMVHSAWDGIDWNHKGTILVNFLTSFNFVSTGYVVRRE